MELVFMGDTWTGGRDLEFMIFREIEFKGMDKNTQGECIELEEKWI